MSNSKKWIVGGLATVGLSAVIALVGYHQSSSANNASVQQVASATEPGQTGGTTRTAGPAGRMMGGFGTREARGPAGAAIQTRGTSGPSEPNAEFRLRLVEGDGAIVPPAILTDLDGFGAVLVECVDSFLARSPAQTTSARATVQLTIVQDPEAGATVTDSEYQSRPDAPDDAELRECIREGAFALRLREPFGPPGTRVVVEVTASKSSTPRALEESARIAACLDEVRQRRPDLPAQGLIPDATFATCMNQATGHPSLPASDEARAGVMMRAADQCIQELRARHPGQSVEQLAAGPEMARCLRTATQRQLRLNDVAE